MKFRGFGTLRLGIWDPASCRGQSVGPESGLLNMVWGVSSISVQLSWPTFSHEGSGHGCLSRHITDQIQDIRLLEPCAYFRDEALPKAFLLMHGTYWRVLFMSCCTMTSGICWRRMATSIHFWPTRSHMISITWSFCRWPRAGRKFSCAWMDRLRAATRKTTATTLSAAQQKRVRGWGADHRPIYSEVNAELTTSM